jgi:hypothetical protein
VFCPYHYVVELFITRKKIILFYLTLEQPLLFVGSTKQVMDKN